MSKAAASPRVVGIDLGTTHCALAYADAGDAKSEAAKPAILDVAPKAPWSAVAKTPLFRAGRRCCVGVAFGIFAVI